MAKRLRALCRTSCRKVASAATDEGARDENPDMKAAVLAEHGWPGGIVGRAIRAVASERQLFSTTDEYWLNGPERRTRRAEYEPTSLDLERAEAAAGSASTTPSTPEV
jgi:hypothetical protein